MVGVEQSPSDGAVENLPSACVASKRWPSGTVNRHTPRRPMHRQVLVDELGEGDRRPARLPGRAGRAPPPHHLLCVPTFREPAHLWSLGATPFEPVALRPQRLPVGTFRLQLEHLTLLDHHEPPRSNDRIEEPRADHLSAREVVNAVHTVSAKPGSAHTPAFSSASSTLGSGWLGFRIVRMSVWRSLWRRCRWGWILGSGSRWSMCCARP